jgi:hypothetical protein
MAGRRHRGAGCVTRTEDEAATSGSRLARRQPWVAVVCLGLIGIGGCGTSTEILKTASLTPTVAISNHSSTHSESTHEIYARVARGAKACWFGAGRPLDLEYAFEGAAAPEADGGAAEVAVHVRTPDQPSPRGGKVFIVAITKVADGSSLAVENRRIQETLADQMRADVARWAKTGSVECGTLTLPARQVAVTPPPLPERKPVKKTSKAKNAK